MGENKADPDDPPMKTKLPLGFHGPKQGGPSGSALFRSMIFLGNKADPDDPPDFDLWKKADA